MRYCLLLLEKIKLITQFIHIQTVALKNMHFALWLLHEIHLQQTLLHINHVLN